MLSRQVVLAEADGGTSGVLSETVIWPCAVLKYLHWPCFHLWQMNVIAHGRQTAQSCVRLEVS